MASYDKDIDNEHLSAVIWTMSKRSRRTMDICRGN